jgi:uncharacterized protein YbjT (DUF2867 family)
MKIVVIGGSGLIGSKLVTKLDEHGHEAVAASPDSGVNTLTGDGLAEVLAALVEAEHSFDLGQGLSQAAHVDPQPVLAGVDPQDQGAVTGVVVGEGDLLAVAPELDDAIRCFLRAGGVDLFLMHC